MGNTIKTALLLGALTGLLMLIGGLIGGRGGVYIAFIFALILNFGSYWFSDKIVLKMYKAQEVSESAAPDLYSIVRNLALKAALPMPRVYIIPEETANAFATGRNAEHAVVAVTEGIMRILNKEELEGVIAHELSHIKNGDMLISSIAATIAGAIGMLATMAQWAAIFGGGRSDDDDHGGIIGLIAMAIFAPLAATVIQMAISRSREYMADAGGARYHQKSLWISRRFGKTYQGFANYPDECQSIHGTFIYCQSSNGKIAHESFQHSPSAGGKNCPFKKHETILKN